MPITISGDSPNFTNATLTTPTITSPAFAGTPTGTGVLTSGTAVTASGTSIDFTSIPSWVKKITVMWNLVSSNGASLWQIQIGSGSVSTSGYNSQAWSASASGIVTSGFLLNQVMQDSYLYTGVANLVLINSNTWVYTGINQYSAGASTGVQIGGSSPNLSGSLDRVRFTTINGTDVFDAGTVNILYE